MCKRNCDRTFTAQLPNTFGWGLFTLCAVGFCATILKNTKTKKAASGRKIFRFLTSQMLKISSNKLLQKLSIWTTRNLTREKSAMPSATLKIKVGRLKNTKQQNQIIEVA